MKKQSKIITSLKDKTPVILNEHGTEKFAKREKIKLDPVITNQMSIVIPPVFYWEDVTGEGKSVKMTMAFQWQGRNYGMSYSIDTENFVIINMQRKKLFQVVKESLDVLIHHGEKIVDQFGNIDPRLVNDEEAIRFKYDPQWEKKVAAFNHLVKIAPITREKAISLKLLDKPKELKI